MKNITAFTVALTGAALLLITFTMSGCAVSVEGDEPPPLPPGCEVQDEYVRVQLCPKQDISLVCSDVGQTNPYPGHCDGPDWTEGQQTTGTAWCCDAGSGFGAAQ